MENLIKTINARKNNESIIIYEVLNIVNKINNLNLPNDIKIITKETFDILVRDNIGNECINTYTNPKIKAWFALEYGVVKIRIGKNKQENSYTYYSEDFEMIQSMGHSVVPAITELYKKISRIKDKALIKDNIVTASKIVENRDCELSLTEIIKFFDMKNDVNSKKIFNWLSDYKKIKNIF